MPTKLFDFIQKNLLIGAVAFGLPLLALIWALAELFSATVLRLPLLVIAICVLAGAWLADRVLNPVTVPSVVPATATTSTSATKPARRRPSKWRTTARRWGKALRGWPVAAWKWLFAARPIVAEVPMRPSRASVAIHAMGSGIAWAAWGLYKAFMWLVSPVAFLCRGLATAAVWTFGFLAAALVRLMGSAVGLIFGGFIFVTTFWWGLKLASLISPQAEDIRLTWLGEWLPPGLVAKGNAWASMISSVLPTWWNKALDSDHLFILALLGMVAVGLILIAVIWNAIQKRRILMGLLALAATFTLFGWVGATLMVVWLSFRLAYAGRGTPAALLLAAWPFFTLLGWMATTLPGAGDPTFWSALWNLALTVPMAFGQDTQNQVWVIACALLLLVDIILLLGVAGIGWAFGAELVRPEQPAAVTM